MIILIHFFVPFILVNFGTDRNALIRVLGGSNTKEFQISNDTRYGGYFYRIPKIGEIENYNILIEVEDVLIGTVSACTKTKFDYQLITKRILANKDFELESRVSNVFFWKNGRRDLLDVFKPTLHICNKYSQLTSAPRNETEWAAIHVILNARYSIAFVNQYVLKKPFDDVTIKEDSKGNWEISRKIEEGFARFGQPAVSATTHTRILKNTGELLSTELDITSRDFLQHYRILVTRKS